MNNPLTETSTQQTQSPGATLGAALAQAAVTGASTQNKPKIVPKYEAKKQDVFRGYSTPVDSSTGRITDAPNSEPEHSAKAVQYYATATADTMKGVASVANGYISQLSAEMKANTYKFQAEQNRNMASQLLKNQREITRAAQMDANQYRMQNEGTKSRQKVAMAESGFAVGRGVYKNNLDTTEARVNYNVANIMLKAGLENANITSKAGGYVAQAIINEADAEIAKKEGEVAYTNGWINGISEFLSAGAMFYCGMVEDGNYANNSTDSGTSTKTQTSEDLNKQIKEKEKQQEIKQAKAKGLLAGKVVGKDIKDKYGKKS